MRITTHRGNHFFPLPNWLTLPYHLGEHTDELQGQGVRGPILREKSRPSSRPNLLRLVLTQDKSKENKTIIAIHFFIYHSRGENLSPFGVTVNH